MSLCTPQARRRYRPSSLLAALLAGATLLGLMSVGAPSAQAAKGAARVAVNYGPVGAIRWVTQRPGGFHIVGWATDPDTAAAIRVRISADGTTLGTVSASAPSTVRNGHGFDTILQLPGSRVAPGAHQICATAINAGTRGSDASLGCAAPYLDYNPTATTTVVWQRRPGAVVGIAGWAQDPDTALPVKVQITVDGKLRATVVADDPNQWHPGRHFKVMLTGVLNGVHTLCATALNTGYGSGASAPSCKTVWAYFSPTGRLEMVKGGSGTFVNLTGWALDPERPEPIRLTVYVDDKWAGEYTADVARDDIGATYPAFGAAHGFSVAIHVLKAKHTVCVRAINVGIGYNHDLGCRTVDTTNPIVPSGLAPQTSPAPISTSRYVRNISGSGTHDLANMRLEGATDASNNPSGHRYMQLLDIGGQDQARGGVLLSAGVRFVTYGNLVKCLNAYVDGYASKQRSGAPAVIAIGTNNDMDVWRAAGQTWADTVVDPVVSYARKYPNLKIAGANDIEPGFIASYPSTLAWLRGYLAATSAPFVFNGSADGCASGYAGSNCNNGWTMPGLAYLAGGAAPTRTVNLPQIYNTTMAMQWRYISLTGVRRGHPKINFGGALTEYTACRQAGCGSLTGNSAWTAMWTQLRAEPALKPSSLPYSTDLRIDW